MKWLQLVYRVPAEPTRKRTYVWRQLRGLGAVYLQDGCCVLPRTTAAEAGLADVASKVREFGGEATLSALAEAEDGWEERMVALVNRARDEEYEEIADTAERLVEEIARETRKSKFTFAALEEVEGEHERLGRWLSRVIARDVCGALGRAEAEVKLAAAGQALEAFAEQVHRQEGAHTTGGADPTGR